MLKFHPLAFAVFLGPTFVKKNVVPSPELLTGRTKLVWKTLNDLINACNLETTWQVQNWNMFTLVYSVRALAAFRPNYRVGKFVNQKNMGKCVRKGLCFKTSWVLHSLCCPKLRLCQHWDSCITFAKFPTRDLIFVKHVLRSVQDRQVMGCSIYK